MNGRGDVYMDSNTGLLSVVDRRTDSNTYGRVVDKREAVLVRNAEVIVSQTKRREVLREGVKNVHAKFRGTVEPGTIEPDPSWIHVGYDVERPGCFYVRQQGSTLLQADRVCITTDGEHPTIRADGVTTGTPESVTPDLEATEVSV